MLSLTPFVEMNGKAREAIDFYSQALGAEVAYKVMLEDTPAKSASPLSPEQKDLVSYALLKIGDAEMQISDLVTGNSYETGTQISIVISTNDKEEATRLYEALRQDGQVNEPLQESFFSPAYGIVTDRFGIMFRILTKGGQ